jgi:hypothetical protein
MVFSLGKRVEPEMGALSMLKMLVFVNFISTFILSIDMFILFIIIRDPHFL